MNNNIISLNQSKIFIGIDLAKKIHVAKAVDVSGNEVAYLLPLQNNEKGFEKFASWIYRVMKQTKVESYLIGMEPTGIYWQRITTFIKNNMKKLRSSIR
ncbi:transposase [uncultured Clostridium sp.]|uniref:IS110 family transposase n=1 Tax=uncultured Clostridium sp. TaxID=59620 RepID=UPI0025D27961|nr:transposase [uncultured Clostridium sp.]